MGRVRPIKAVVKCSGEGKENVRLSGRNWVPLCLFAVIAIGSTGEATAQTACFGPFYDSSAWNIGGWPHEGGCWLSGAICYECVDLSDYETCGADSVGTNPDSSTQLQEEINACIKTLAKPFHRSPLAGLTNPPGVTVRVCFASSYLSGTAPVAEELEAHDSIPPRERVARDAAEASSVL